MAADLLVRNVRPLGGNLADIVILAGRIASEPAPNVSEREGHRSVLLVHPGSRASTWRYLLPYHPMPSSVLMPAP
jgi:hypothetical protein